jgi:16S rRNA C967 or C1407 C5-methylase (RsmB/RsmF family)/NOL1/NOP2/fmu family ribosome biogenesis protein
MGALLGDELPEFLAALRAPAVRGLRVNPAKVDPDELARLLGVELTTPVPWAGGHGFVLPPDGPSLGFHPAVDCGLLYLQDPASMLAPALLAPEPGWRVADVAAAPGGKTTDLAARVGRAGLVLANDVSRLRLRLLESALDRWGSPAVATSSAALGNLLGAWDAVLLDAPCTGEAIARREPDALREWSEASVAGNARRQARLLDAVAPLVRSGGVLVYSTCSFEPAENEDQVAAFVERHDGWELERSERVWPHRDPGDGQFAARLVRTGDGPVRTGDGPVRAPGPSVKGRPGKEAVAAWRAFRSDTLPGFEAAEDAITQVGDALFLTPQPDKVSFRGLSRPGLPLGRARPGRFEPAPALATAVDPGHAAELLPCTPEYLRGETSRSPGPDGWALVTYERWGLGWARRSKGVLKNFFPKGQRRG